MIKILAIESSCDETAASVVEDGCKVLSNVINSQANLHKKYGGVVPEVASRLHIEAIDGVVKQALIDAGIGEDVFSRYDYGVKQPMFTIVAKHVDKNREQEFLDIIKIISNYIKIQRIQKSVSVGFYLYSI